MSRAVKIKDLEDKNLVKKEELQVLRGRVFVLNPEESEIAQHLKIKEKGIFGLRFK